MLDKRTNICSFISMKLPTGIVTKHKIRDCKILSLYATDAWTFEEIGKRFDISATRVGQIIYKNRALLQADRAYEKAKRVVVLKRLLKKHPDTIGQKTTLDIVEQIRTEYDGKDGSEPVGRSDTRVIIIRESASPVVNNRISEVIDGDQDQSRSVPGSVSFVRV